MFIRKTQKSSGRRPTP